MSNVLVVYEGNTEQAFHHFLQTHLQRQYDAAGIQVRVGFRSKTWLKELKNDDKLVRSVERVLREGEFHAIVALTDLYPRFSKLNMNAATARKHLEAAVGRPGQFFAHIASHDFEAWLLPFWDKITKRVRCQAQMPGAHPEEINGGNPPSEHLKRLYRTSNVPSVKQYEKVIEVREILKGEDLMRIAAQCPEFKAFLNTVHRLAGLAPLS